MIRVRIWIARLAIWVCGLGITALLIALAQATHLAIQARAVRDGVNLWSTLGRSFLGIGGDLASANASLEVVAAFAAGIGGLIPIVLGTIIEIRNGQVKRLGPFAEERLGSGRRANRKAERIMRKYYTCHKSYCVL
jgi:hypothetical protein